MFCISTEDNISYNFKIIESGHMIWTLEIDSRKLASGICLKFIKSGSHTLFSECRNISGNARTSEAVMSSVNKLFIFSDLHYPVMYVILSRGSLHLKTMIQFRIEEMYHVNILSCIGVLR
jgi:hypothetical protein